MQVIRNASKVRPDRAAGDLALGLGEAAWGWVPGINERYRSRALRRQLDDGIVVLGTDWDNARFDDFATKFPWRPTPNGPVITASGPPRRRSRLT